MMVGLKISSEEIKEIIPILGLTDDDQGKVYLSLLSLGTATLGQISLLSGLDYIKTQDALQVLVGSKLVKRIPGIVGQYIALEPFLKAFFLAYDPITLVNIQKESSNAFQNRFKQIDGIYSETTETFQKYTKELEDDFSQSLAPIEMNFNNLITKLNQIIQSSEDQIKKSIGVLETKTKMVDEQSEKLNDEICDANLTKLGNIPKILDPYIPIVTQNLASISQMTNNALETYRINSRSDLESSKNDIHEKITNFSKTIDKILNQFENNRFKDEKEFETKIERSSSSLENLRSNAIQKKTKFNDIREGYSEVDETIKDLFTELESKLSHMEPLLTNSIDDIKSRKLFKGKDEFLSGLKQLDGDRKAIQDIIKDKQQTFGKITRLNQILNETEDEIVQATDIGIQKVKKILDDEIKLLLEDLQHIKQNICSEFKNSIHDCLDTKKQELKTEIGVMQDNFSKEIDNIKQELQEIIDKFMGELTSFVQQTADKLETSLKSYLKDKSNLELGRSSFTEIADNIKNLSTNATDELKNVSNQISELENSFNAYISGINAFIANFSDTQLGEANSTLSKTKELLNSQISGVEHQLDQEISALTFSIKEMKQKLNKISDLSRSVVFTEVDPSLISSNLVVGEPSIIMILRDLTLRAKSSLTILMPRPELQTLVAASKLPMRTRVSIIGDFKKVPESTLKKILSTANLRLKQLDEVDFWGCIRDAEELLVCPEPKHPEKEELLGIITTNENLVELFSKELITYTTRSRDIIL